MLLWLVLSVKKLPQNRLSFRVNSLGIHMNCWKFFGALIIPITDTSIIFISFIISRYHNWTERNSMHSKTLLDFSTVLLQPNIDYHSIIKKSLISEWNLKVESTTNHDITLWKFPIGFILYFRDLTSLVIIMTWGSSSRICHWDDAMGKSIVWLETRYSHVSY